MRGDLTADDVASVVVAGQALADAHKRRAVSERLATLNERTAFEALLRAIGEAVEDGYRIAS